MLSRNRVEEVLENCQGKNIVVLGDLMLDEFIWGKVRRISPEAPVPVVEVIEETYRLGGAANVAANIRSLGAVPIPIGVIGCDRAGERIVELMTAGGISTEGLIREDRVTTLKSRILAHNQQIARTDRETRAPLGSESNSLIETAFLKALNHAEAVVISDYDKGVVNRELLSKILLRARAAGVSVFLDPKVHHADYYHPVTMLTPNQAEAELLSGMAIRTGEALEDAGRKILQKFGCEYLLVTRGEEG